MRTVSTLTVGLAILAGVCWFVTAAFPLSAAPQSVTDAAGVTVNAQGAHFMHRSAVMYPRDAQLAGIEGTVVAQVTLDANGNVSDESILSGPEQLRKPVLQSLLSWHFTKDAAGSTRQIAVTFRLPDAEETATPKVATSIEGVNAQRETELNGGVTGGVVGGNFRFRPALAPGVLGSVPSDGSELVTIQAIRLEGLGIPDDEFLAKLPPLHVNDRVSRRSLSDFMQAVRQMDEHLMTSYASASTAPNSVTVRISAPNVAEIARPVPAFPGAIPVGGRVQNAKLISHEDPVYPELAKSYRISGTVELKALIGPDGHMKQLSVISGHPLLQQAALDAVKTWVYAPTLVNNNPVSVSTTIDVIFTLSQ